MDFMGYKRTDGSAGTRNYVGVFSMVVCANEVSYRISQNVLDTACFLHQQGCCQTSIDIERVNTVLSNLAKNPNIHSLILVSLGCESSDLRRVVEEVSDSGKRIESLVIQENGGAAESVARGTLLAQKMVIEASTVRRVPCPLSDIVLGLKCGGSDTTSGLASNPALGIASDLFESRGATIVAGETTEIIGAEHLVVKKAINRTVSDQILSIVSKMEQRAMSVGTDIRGGQPTGGNIKGGLTTIEEKSLGAVIKFGNSKIREVCEYGIQPREKGLVLMDSPGREPELLTGLASAGCNLIAFTTGRGAPQGFPFIPVLKISANRNTWKKLSDHIDLDVSGIMSGTKGIEEEGERIFHELIEVAGGKRTKAETLGYVNSMDIYMTGPVI
jgi:altronate dehydratase large subunit